MRRRAQWWAQYLGRAYSKFQVALFFDSSKYELVEIWTFATLNNCDNRGQIIAIYVNCHDMMVVGSRGNYLRGLNFGPRCFWFVAINVVFAT